MAYVGVTETNVLATLRDAYSPDILKGALLESAVLPLMKRLPNFGTHKEVMPVLATLVQGYFPGVDGTNDIPNIIQTSGISWEGINLYAEKVAALVPLPKDVIEDSEYDIEGQVVPAIKEALAAVIDAAILHGTGKPTNWPDGIYTVVNAAGQVVSQAAFADLYDALLSSGGAFGLVEADGFMVNGMVVHPTMLAAIRECRSTGGVPIFMPTPTETFKYSVNGQPMSVALNGAVASANGAKAFVGDFKQAVYAVRKELTFEVLKEATITAGTLTINLAQQEMIAIKAVMRMGWQLPNPINRMQPTKANRCAFSVLTA